MIQALFIDFDGVLRIWNSEDDRRAEAMSGLPLGAIRRVAFAQDILTPAITGQIADEEWRSIIIERLRTEFPSADVAQAVRVWSTSPGAVDHAVLDLVRRCRQKIKVLLITNATSRLLHDLEQLSLVKEFDVIINSSVVGSIKPHPAIYNAALNAVGVSAQETLFVDDSPGHVASAIQLGIRAYVYQSSDQFRHVLKQHELGE